MLSIRLAPNEEFELAEGRFRFKIELPDNRALFVRDDSVGEVVLTERQIETAISEGKFKRLTSFKDALGRRAANNDNAEVGPDGPSDPLARARAFYTREWDKAPTSLTTKALQSFVSLHSAKAAARGIDWAPSAGSMRRMIQSRGCVGNRPLRVMQSRRGKSRAGPRFGPFLDGLLGRAVAFYYAERSRNVTDAYAYFRAALAVVERLAPTKHPQWRPLPIPSYETLRSRIRDAECHDTRASKYSPDEARRKFRGTAEGLRATRILEKVVIDSTPDDICILDLERMLPLGNPTLTLSIDVYSRMILSVIATFEPMSLYTAMSALLETNTPKHGWIEAHDGPIRDYDGWGKPDTIIVDNAWEQVGVSYQDACEDAGISVEWAPVENPEYKALCERFIRTLQALVTHKVQGSTPFPAHIMRKLKLRPKTKACIGLDQYRQLIRHALIEVYQMGVHSVLGKAPALAWRESKARHGRQYVADLALLAASFGVTDDATLTREGVRFRSLRFHDQHLVSRLLDQLAGSTPYRGRRTGSATAGVKIKYDPADCRKIQVWNHVAGAYVALSCTDATYVEAPLSWAQHDMVRRFAEAENLEFQSDAEKWASRNRLREMVESFAGDLKTATMKRVRRLLHPPDPHRPIDADTVRFGTVRPSVGGLGASDIPATVSASLRADEGLPEPGPRRGGGRGNKPQRRRNVRVAPKHAGRQEPVASAVVVVAQSATLAAALGQVDLSRIEDLDWVNGIRPDA